MWLAQNDFNVSPFGVDDYFHRSRNSFVTLTVQEPLSLASVSEKQLI